MGEQERRNKADVVAKTAEKVRKGKLVIAERKARQKKDKAEKGFHNAVVIKCTKRSDDAYLKCEKDKLAEQKVKASEKKYKYKKEKAEKKKKKHMAWLKKMMEKKAKAAAQTYSSTQGKMVKGL